MMKNKNKKSNKNKTKKIISVSNKLDFNNKKNQKLIKLSHHILKLPLSILLLFSKKQDIFI